MLAVQHPDKGMPLGNRMKIENESTRTQIPPATDTFLAKTQQEVVNLHDSSARVLIDWLSWSFSLTVSLPFKPMCS